MKAKPIVPGDNFNWFLYWCCERMNIFWRKYNGLPQEEWTDDPILKSFKFTNLYRILDRASQYLVREVIYNGKQYEVEDQFFRILLYKHFNLPSTWELFKNEFGDITYETGIDNIVKFCDEAMAQGWVLYSNAYMIGAYFYNDPNLAYIKNMPKYQAQMTIWRDLIFENGYLYDILESQSFEELYNRLHALPIFGDFIAQQYCIDLMYSPLFDFSENDFVVTGPGSLRGIKWTFEDVKGSYDYVGAIRWTQENFEERMKAFCEETGMEWHPLPWEPVPTLTNIQNCFCEISKYAKGLGYTFQKGRKQERIKNVYEKPKTPIDFMFPPKWGVKMPLPGEIVIK